MHLIASIRQNIEYVANSVLLNGWLSQRCGKRVEPKCLLFPSIFYGDGVQKALSLSYWMVGMDGIAIA
jgi:hypothetical protein